MHINSPRNLIFVRGRERERGLGEGTSRLMFSFSAQDDSVISDRNECVDSSPFFHHLTDIPLFFFLSLSLKIIWGFFSLHHTFLDDKLMRSKQETPTCPKFKHLPVVRIHSTPIRVIQPFYHCTKWPTQFDREGRMRSFRAILIRQGLESLHWSPFFLPPLKVRHAPFSQFGRLFIFSSPFFHYNPDSIK